jgi:16S rRNA (guanine966-N2)-methyltransferase
MSGSKDHEVRVLAGTLKGRVLVYPAGARVRPTMQRTKASVFDSLGGRVEGGVFVDLYAGAGGVGIEALSRGAARVVFVESDARAIAYLRRNLERCGADPSRAVVRFGAVIDFLESDALRDLGADVVYADPPYEADEIRLLLEFFDGIEYPLDALLLVEHRKGALPVDSYERLGALKVREFGQSCVSYIELGGKG